MLQNESLQAERPFASRTTCTFRIDMIDQLAQPITYFSEKALAPENIENLTRESIACTSDHRFVAETSQLIVLRFETTYALFASVESPGNSG